MGAGTSDLLALGAGVLVAGVLLGAFLALRRLALAVRSVLRLAGQRWRAMPTRAGGRRLTHSRALARAEAARAGAAILELRRLRAEMRLLRAERDAALARLAQAGRNGRRRLVPGPRPDDRFLRAKRAFALRFHPDRLPRDAPDRAACAAMFRDYWQELRRIELG